MVGPLKKNFVCMHLLILFFSKSRTRNKLLPFNCMFDIYKFYKVILTLHMNVIPKH